jgi:hypothetical protein
MCLGKVLVPHRRPHPLIGRGTAGFRELTSAAMMPRRLGEGPALPDSGAPAHHEIVVGRWDSYRSAATITVTDHQIFPPKFRDQLDTKITVTN